MSSSLVHGVMVTHHPPADFETVVEQCARQVVHLFLIDNGSRSGTPLVARIAGRLSNVTLVEYGENRGIAAALNDGVTRALADGADWVLTMDHDTLLPSDAVAAMLAAVARCGAPAQIGLVAPRYLMRGKPARPAPPDRPCREMRGVVTSANLVRSEVFRRAGLFDASFFIDYVDFEFCLRVRRAGFRIVEIPSVAVDHRLGEVRDAHVLGMRIRHTHYDPVRRYMKMRNRVRTYRRHFARFPGWVAMDLWRMPWELASAAVFEEKKVASVRAMVSGLWDGLSHDLALPPSLPK